MPVTGDKRAPIFVGGGVVFGPRPCDYTKKVNKSTRRLALRRVLGDLDRRFQGQHRCRILCR